jgi:short-subunit dehydrogenase
VVAQGRVIVITGATGGLGKELVRIHLMHGDQVVATGRDANKLEELKELALSLGRPDRLHPYELDVTDNQAVRACAAWVQIRFDRCDFLYNNAGAAVFKPFLETSPDQMEQTLRTNVSSLFYVTRAFLPMMLSARCGHIVNIASLAGRVATAKAAVYAASKAAVIRFSEGLRHELAGSGVTVTCAMPGPIDTPFLDRADATGQYRDNVRRFLLTPEQAARLIRQAAEAGKPEVVLPRRLHLLSITYSLLPHTVQRWVAPLLNRK